MRSAARVLALFRTSLADGQVPHAMMEPTIARLEAAGRVVTVYTAAKSLNGFYWGRDVGGALEAHVGRGARRQVNVRLTLPGGTPVTFRSATRQSTPVSPKGQP